MLFTYKAVTSDGIKKEGDVDASTKDQAIGALQRRGFIVTTVYEKDEHKSLWKMTFFEHVPMKDIVVMSRQISTLFEAQVSALKAFSLLATNTENPLLAKILNKVCDDLQAGTSISGSLAKYPDIFSDFYVNMVKAGEETGKLNQIFLYLADYLDRQYSLTSKTKNALIYPAFVMGVSFVVMILMFVFIVPNIANIITESGQAVPFYTQAILWFSGFLIHYGIIMLIIILAFAYYVYRLSQSDHGQSYLDAIKLKIPVVKIIFTKLYLSRMADNMDTMLSSGIPILRAIEITSGVVGNRVYQNILKEASEDVKSGVPLSAALSKHKEIPPIMAQMVKVGEETGSMGNILKTLGKFYNREAGDAVDTLVSLIEPIMIVVLGLGVGLLVASVLIPIYNIAGGIS